MLADTHRAVRDLTEVGVPQDQAERFVDVVTRADDKVATKNDLERAKWQIVVMTTAAVGTLLAVFEFLL